MKKKKNVCINKLNHYATRDESARSENFSDSVIKRKASFPSEL